MSGIVTAPSSDHDPSQPLDFLLSSLRAYNVGLTFIANLLGNLQCYHRGKAARA